MNELLFSLDIGTRTVVGVVSMLDGDHYKVVDYEIKAHPDRAMYDGQIHDIQKVTKVVQDVKEVLELRNNVTFKNVAIAAAGRALITEKVTVERELDVSEAITQEMINNVEMEGIQLAQNEIDAYKRSNESRYYCVGYNVCNYYIDDILNINPKDHKGHQLKIELIATFLPHIVVDSLYTVVDRVGLEVLNMTLEPIAAINVAIPQNLRLLNLALVDVGAGTSDIAITKEGTVISFGMVAAAGDKFTEEIAKHFLLDFNQAEALKLSLNQQDEHSYMDIIGMSHTKTTEEIIEPIKGRIYETAKMIAEQIIAFNEKSPSAVFCIGGGCQIPMFTEVLAEMLELPKERVVIKPVETLTEIQFEKTPLKGPEFITPLGIGVTALKEKENDFLQIMVDDKAIRLFNSKPLNVSDALILIGYNARALLPERGESIDYILNGKNRSLKGGYGTPAQIFVNGSIASLDTRLKNKDVIHIEPGTPGQNAHVLLGDLVRPFSFRYNDETEKSKMNVKVNHLEVAVDYEIQSGDHITFDEVQTVEDLIQIKSIQSDGLEFYINGEHVPLATKIQKDDIVRSHEVQVAEVIEEAIIVEETVDIKPTSNSYDYFMMVNGKNVNVKAINRKMVFVDIFDYIDFDLSQPRGILDLKLNGNKANYTDPLKNGDIIEIKWQQTRGN